MSKVIPLLLAALLSGCGVTKIIYWGNALEKMTCTPEQFDRALSEAVRLEKNDDSGKYFEYWMGGAVMRICSINQSIKDES